MITYDDDSPLYKNNTYCLYTFVLCPFACGIDAVVVYHGFCTDIRVVF